MFMGNLLARAALEESKEVAWIPSYGAEVRGGTAHCMVVISEEPIGCPLVDLPDTAILMNEPSFEKFERKIKKGGLLILNVSLVKRNLERADLEVLKIPATEVAAKLGDVRVANIVALGAYIKKKKLLLPKNILLALKENLAKGKENLFQINERAFEEGMKFSV